MGIRGTRTMILGLKLALACVLAYVVMQGVRLFMGYSTLGLGYEVAVHVPFVLGAAVGLYYFFVIPNNVEIF